MNTDILLELGLTEREAQLYRLLLKIGESPIADLIKQLNIHPQVVYRAVESLKEKQLVIMSFRRHRQYVRAEDPTMLERLEKERLERIQREVPLLVALTKTSKDAVIRVGKGNEVFRKMRMRAYETLKSGETFYVVGAGAGGRFFETMREQHAELERKRIKKGVIRKMIAYANQHEIITKGDSLTELVETRYLPYDNATPTSTNIFGTTTAIVIWSAEPIVITIESKDVAKSFIDHFDILWQVAEVNKK